MFKKVKAMSDGVKARIKKLRKKYELFDYMYVGLKWVSIILISIFIIILFASTFTTLFWIIFVVLCLVGFSIFVGFFIKEIL